MGGGNISHHTHVQVACCVACQGEMATVSAGAGRLIMIVLCSNVLLCANLRLDGCNRCYHGRAVGSTCPSSP